MMLEWILCWPRVTMWKRRHRSNRQLQIHSINANAQAVISTIYIFNLVLGVLIFKMLRRQNTRLMESSCFDDFQNFRLIAALEKKTRVEGCGRGVVRNWGFWGEIFNCRFEFTWICISPIHWRQQRVLVWMRCAKWMARWTGSEILAGWYNEEANF